MKKNTRKLPGVLSYYSKSDYTTQQKARFIYHLCIAAMVGMVFLTFSSIYVQLNSIEYDGIFLPVIFAEISLLIFFGGCIFLLIKGKYGIASHLFMTVAMACVWYVMWMHGGNVITRLDTVVLIVALLNLTPLFITKYKITILLYILVNVVILIVFVQMVKGQINLSDASAVDYIVDTSIAILFSGVVGYNIFRINKQSLEKVEIENQQRKLAENALLQSELFRRSVFDSSITPIIVMDSTSFKYIDINPAAVKIYGFSSISDSLGKTPVDVSAPVQYDGTPSSQKAVSYIEKALEDGSVTFEWLHQRPDGEFWDAEVHLLSFQSNNETLLQFSLIDITERKKIESELRESELRYRLLFENAQIGIYRTTPEGKILQANPAIIKMLGFDSLDELNKRNLETEEAFVKSTRKEFIKRIEKNGFVKDFESEWNKKNNDILIIKENSRAVCDAEGKTLYYDGFVENITERKKIESDLKESELRYRTLFENAQIGIYQSTHEGKFLQANPALIKMLGFDSFEELSKRNSNEENAYVDLSRGKVIELFEKNGFIKDFESKWKRKNNEMIIIKENSRVVRNLEGKILYYEGFVENITERKLAEIALKESEEKYRTLMENMNDIVMMVDNEDKVLYVNERFSEKLGYSYNEIIGEIGYKKLLDPKDQEIIIKANQERTKNVISQYETTFIAKDGRNIDFLISGAPVKNSEGIIIGSIGNMIDITEKKKIEKELEKHRDHLEFLVKERTEELATSNEELLSTNEELHNQRDELEAVLKNLQNTQKQLVQAAKMASLGVLASGVAHEINNPLNFIKGGIFGLEQYFDENLKEHKNEVFPLIEGINIGVERAANIVTSLNHYSRRNDSNVSECDIHTIVDNCLEILRNQIHNRIDVKKTYTQTSHTLYGNEGKLHQAMLNILSNAVQAINDEGTINIKTSISVQKLTILVSDTGCGISDEDIPKIFDPFFTTKEPGQGTGLGLSITHNILEEHNGNIEFESNVGHGSSVKITLPLSKK
ncbi:MAG: PAS domain S-box protein [Bacteroidales bacterium]|nr:PAS domain S-box protein [Bacteroidales bacterium]